VGEVDVQRYADSPIVVVERGGLSDRMERSDAQRHSDQGDSVARIVRDFLTRHRLFFQLSDGAPGRPLGPPSLHLAIS
jgi:hypothetical protein